MTTDRQDDLTRKLKKIKLFSTELKQKMKQAKKSETKDK